MKASIVIATLIFSSSVHAERVFVKECSVTMKNLDSSQSVSSTLQIVRNNETISSVISQTTKGETSAYDDDAEIVDERVRAGLTASSDLKNLNRAESLVVHAMILTEDPVFRGEYSAGLDLARVRAARLFAVGKKTDMGSTTIVEARDENDQPLGSFLGGFLVSPCLTREK